MAGIRSVFEADVELIEREPRITLFMDWDLRGIDLVEVVPEPSRVTEMVAAKLLQKIISFWGKAHHFDRNAQNGSQMQVRYD